MRSTKEIYLDSVIKEKEIKLRGINETLRINRNEKDNVERQLKVLKELMNDLKVI